MAQSEEHRFVSSTFINTVRELSNSELYGYLEADRGGFDFACILERDHSRPLVGQTLRSHSEGIEKDINFLLFAEDSEIPIYLYSDNARNVTRIRDTLHRASSSLSRRVELMRLYSYPAKFDADNEAQRKMMRGLLREKIVDDLLMNVLFGRLTSADVAMFLSTATMPGFLLACLEEMAARGIVNFTDLAKRLNSKSSTTRTRVHSLWAAGMVQDLNGAICYRLTERAQVILKVCHLITTQKEINTELSYILDKLGLTVGRPEEMGRDGFSFQFDDPVSRWWALRTEIESAKRIYGVEVSGGPYLKVLTPTPPGYDEATAVWIGR